MNGLQTAIKAAGNQRRLATLIGTWPQTVNRWVNRYQGIVPAEWVGKIYTATGVTPHELRPDLHPTPTSGIPDNTTVNQQEPD
ncbi:helix-turn-helix domain-containing protein [Citrobacter amalonaticus]|uniref:transcriptional regulator n=1 Tax=Citrobacter amalonaticus TaxID=35703 RepID=UPI00215CF26F|nr:helix-turn-helix domain-containing protein [Citrobacter amalonaticus]MCR9028374.1 helix-turn-helix domain-containing protein [Citrobacter amalonaticus]